MSPCIFIKDKKKTYAGYKLTKTEIDDSINK